jgi:integrase
VDEHVEELTLDVYVVEWLERRRSQLRPTTLKSYRQAVDCYIRPNLGGLRLDEVDRRRLERFYAWLLVGGGRGGKPLSPTSVQYVHAILGRVFEDARLDGLLVTNPVRGARRPTRHPDEVELDDIPAVWTPAQAARFLAFVDDHELRALWHLALGTGARRGELLGLRWQDVDLDEGRICIQRALSVVDGVPRLLATKTAKRRTLSVAESVVAALRCHKRMQQRWHRDAADWRDRWGLVFTDEVGAPVDPMRVTKAFRALVANAPVPVIRLHDLRHFHASALLEAGVPVTVVSRRLGHASATMTLDVYGHVLPAADADAANTLEAMMADG